MIMLTSVTEFQTIIFTSFENFSSDDDDLRESTISILGEVLAERCAAFHNSLKMHASNMETAEKVLSSLAILFKALLTQLPETSWNVLPVDELLQNVKLLAESDILDDKNDLLPKAEELVKLRNERKDQQKVKIISANCMVKGARRTWANDEYRLVQVLPKWEEIRDPRPPYQLRPNIVDGPYEDWMHYFDIQFRLLREDLISPLRKGVNNYLVGKVGRDLRNIKIYNDVEIKRPLFTRAGLCYEVRFTHLS